jgi:hypothetical protein
MNKKLPVLVLTLCGMVAAGCASGAERRGAERKVPGKFPAFVKEAIRNQNSDTLIGVGVAKLGGLNQSMTLSATRARADISRQLNTLVKDMVTDYQAASELDPQAALSYQENITVALSRSTLTGATVIGQDEDSQGRVWTVVSISKNSVASEINQAASAARLAVPKAAAFNAADRMDTAFKKLSAEEITAAGD